MIVITGASDGLGYEVAKVYKQAGTTVVNISRRECPAADYNLLYDLSIGEEIEKAVSGLQQITDSLEAIINCVGVWTEEPIGEISEGEIKRAMATNAKSNILLTSLLLERIKKDGTDIVNVVSTAGLKGNSNHSVYVASKWAQRGYTLSLQDELKKTKSRVISFCPGGIKTKLFEKNLGKDITDDGTYWMDPKALAIFIKQILDLPKNIEVSEIAINRKSGK